MSSPRPLNDPETGDSNYPDQHAKNEPGFGKPACTEVGDAGRHVFRRGTVASRARNLGVAGHGVAVVAAGIASAAGSYEFR